MIELRYHPNETSFITSIRPSDGPPSAYVAKGVEMRGATRYEVTTLSFYYKENLAIGLGSCFFPRAPSLGYHPHDIEHVSIYTHDGTPEWVFFSAHSRGQGMWLPWEECEKSGENLVVYVALNSHACYPRSGVYLRVFGLANDQCSSRGYHQVIPVEHMVPSYDYAFPNGIRLYKGLRAAPPSESVSPLGRFFVPLSFFEPKKTFSAG